MVFRSRERANKHIASKSLKERFQTSVSIRISAEQTIKKKNEIEITNDPD